MNQSLNTSSLHQLVDRHRAGDRDALDELVRRCGLRLQRLARRMLRSFPAVQAREEADDVLQNALLRLDRALREVRPDDTGAFISLAAEMIRRELLDLARFHRRRANVQQSLEPATGNFQPADNRNDPVELDRWTAFHEAVAGLPDVEREAFSLVFYHGWTQIQAAEQLGVSDRQVRRRWVRACLLLNERLGGEIPIS